MIDFLDGATEMYHLVLGFMISRTVSRHYSMNSELLKTILNPTCQPPNQAGRLADAEASTTFARVRLQLTFGASVSIRGVATDGRVNKDRVAQADSTWITKRLLRTKFLSGVPDIMFHFLGMNELQSQGVNDLQRSLHSRRNIKSKLP